MRMRDESRRKWASTRLFAASVLLMLSVLSYSTHVVWATPVSCGTTITSNTFLTADLLDCPSDGITIGASGITLDCQNHMIAGSGNFATNVEGISSQGQLNIIIRNCVVQNFRFGVLLRLTNQSQLTNNNADNNFIAGFDLLASVNNTLTHNTALKSGPQFGAGFFLGNASYNVLTHNNSLNGTLDGFRIAHGSRFNTLDGNVAENNAANGILLFDASDRNTLVNNRVDGNGFAGTGFYGFVLASSHNTLSNNTALNTGNSLFGAGFALGAGFGLGNSSYNLLTHNTSLNETSFGFAVFGDGNTSSTNSNVFRDNLARDNRIGFFLVGSMNLNTFDRNVVEQNTRFGFVVLNATGSNAFTENLVESNGFAGFAEGFSTKNNIFASNVVEKNPFGFLSDNTTSGNLIYNNMFQNLVNAEDNGTNTWNIAKTLGTNIVGGPFLGGNFWSDYQGTDLDTDGLGDTLLPYNSNGLIVNGGDFLPLVSSQLRLSAFFTDPTLSPLPLDSKGNPSVVVLLARGLVRSTSPGQVLAWVSVTNTGSTPLQSLSLNESLPVDWVVSPAWTPSAGAIHVFFANSTSLATNLDITQPSTITVSQGNPETVSLSIPSVNTTLIGHPLMPAQSILLSVKLTYDLKGTSQSASGYPRNYTDTSLAVAWTKASFTGIESTGSGSAFFTAYAKVVG